jgi:hypothetical protein
LRNNVILHKSDDIAGFVLEQIKDVTVTPEDTTTLKPLNKMSIYMMSAKAIPGGSKIYVYAPRGFIFTCDFFRTDDGLGNTTTCYVLVREGKPNEAIFTLDSKDPKVPNSPFTLFVMVMNPEFTPQENTWSFKIKDALRRDIDVRDSVGGFWITGRVPVVINPTFAFVGETNPLQIDFTPSTIMNQADHGNELDITAPEGWQFPMNCSGVKLRLKNERAAPADDTGAGIETIFPPPGITCTGYGNRSMTMRLPDGVGLLLNVYTLEIDVINPGYLPDQYAENIWQFVSRVWPA